MRKSIIYIIFAILLLSLVSGIEECDSPLDPSFIPCMVISTYSFDNGCINNTAKIYSSNSDLVGETVYDEWGGPGRCNFTFNFTDKDSYVINSTDGSSATIIIRGEKMELVSLMVFGLFFLIGLALVVFMHIFTDQPGSSIAYGFFAAAIFLIIGSLTFLGWEVINIGIALPFNVNTMIGIICYMLAIYTSWYSTTFLNVKKKEKGEIEEKQFQEGY